MQILIRCQSQEKVRHLIVWEPECSPENHVSVNKGLLRALKKAKCTEEHIKDVHEVQCDANKQTYRKVKTLPLFTDLQR